MILLKNLKGCGEGENFTVTDMVKQVSNSRRPLPYSHEGKSFKAS